MQAIRLDKDLGPVVFLGGINAMPMMYAIELRRSGIEVLYFVDRPRSDALSRPENHFQDIKYPYPNWVVEATLPSQIFLPLFREFFSRWVMRIIARHANKPPQAFVLNGFFCSLVPYLKSEAPKIFLPGGSDLDSWADVERAQVLGQSFAKRSIFKYLPIAFSRKIIKTIVQRQFFGAGRCAKVIYFPRGFNEAGDRILKKLEEKGVDVLARYDVSFDPLKHETRGVVKDQGSLIIFSGVRFLFKNFPDGNEGYGKGNDVIIEGLAQYYQQNKNIEIHFVEKGEDVAEAKKLCAQLGIKDVVVWHKEMKFIELLSLYRAADICFDQVGAHWIGAIGFYALWLGKPLIANDKRAIEAGLWDVNAPILSATTPQQVKKHLIALQSHEFRESISKESMIFAESKLGPTMVLATVFDYSR